MSERRIFETFRSELKAAPSYRELRVVWKETGARHGRIGKVKGARIERDGTLNRAATSDYRERSKFVRKEVREGKLPPDRSAKLDRNFAIGYLGIHSVAPENFSQVNVEEYFRDPSNGSPS
jgi:hypothetical protein